MKVIGALFAGGKGRRMGGVDKACLKLGGRAFHEIVSAELNAVTDGILVLSPDKPDWLIETPKMQWVPDTKIDGQEIGPAGGLHAALVRASALLGPDALVLTVPVDSPLVSHFDLRTLSHKAVGAGRPVVAKLDGCVQPAFGVWPVTAASAILNAIQAGERALHRLASGLGADFVTFECGCPTFFNVNSPGDLDRAEAALRSSQF